MARNPWRNRGAKTMWDKQHGGKLVHASRDAALAHIVRLRTSEGEKATEKMNAYPCLWAEERGIKGKDVHWHVGHAPGTGRGRHEDGKAEAG